MHGEYCSFKMLASKSKQAKPGIVFKLLWQEVTSPRELCAGRIGLRTQHLSDRDKDDSLSHSRTQERFNGKKPVGFCFLRGLLFPGSC